MASDTFSIEIRSPQDQAAFERLRDILTTTLGLEWRAPLGFPDGCEVADDCAEALWAAGFRVAPTYETPRPVDGRTDPCPAPGDTLHVAVGAGAISSPYLCHGCGTWFTLPARPHPTAHGTTEPQPEEGA